MKRHEMDHSLGTGEPTDRPHYALSHVATENPTNLEEDENVPSSEEMATPEYHGHMRRIKNKGRS